MKVSLEIRRGNTKERLSTNFQTQPNVVLITPSQSRKGHNHRNSHKAVDKQEGWGGEGSMHTYMKQTERDIDFIHYFGL